MCPNAIYNFGATSLFEILTQERYFWGATRDIVYNRFQKLLNISMCLLRHLQKKYVAIIRSSVWFVNNSQKCNFYQFLNLFGYPRVSNVIFFELVLHLLQFLSKF